MVHYLVTIARGGDIDAVRAGLATLGTVDDVGCERIPRLCNLHTAAIAAEVEAVDGVESAVPADTAAEGAAVVTDDVFWAGTPGHTANDNIGCAMISAPDRLALTAGATYGYGYDRDGDGVDIYMMDARPPLVPYEGLWTEIFAAYGGTGPGLHSFVFGPLNSDIGVARGAHVRLCVALPDNSFSTTSSKLVACLNAALADYLDRADTGRPAVLTTSVVVTGFGGDPTSAAIEALIDAGILVISAAGNNNRSNPSPGGSTWPAANPDVIGVGNMLADEARASHSNYGTQTEIYACGGDFATADSVSKCSTTYEQTGSGNRRPGNGTSSAAPHVAGVAACLLTGYGRLRGRQDALALRAALLGLSKPDRASGVPSGPRAVLHKPEVLGADPLGIPDLWLGIGAEPQPQIAITVPADARVRAPWHVSPTFPPYMRGYPFR